MGKVLGAVNAMLGILERKVVTIVLRVRLVSTMQLPEPTYLV
jgi:hypothetical protein